MDRLDRRSVEKTVGPDLSFYCCYFHVFSVCPLKTLGLRSAMRAAAEKVFCA